MPRDPANLYTHEKNKCKHGRSKYRCRDCGTGYCQHGRQKHQCKECGTGHCKHGRQKNKCKKCLESNIIVKQKPKNIEIKIQRQKIEPDQIQDETGVEWLLPPPLFQLYDDYI